MRLIITFKIFSSGNLLKYLEPVDQESKEDSCQPLLLIHKETYTLSIYKYLMHSILDSSQPDWISSSPRLAHKNKKWSMIQYL